MKELVMIAIGGVVLYYLFGTSPTAVSPSVTSIPVSGNTAVPSPISSAPYSQGIQQGLFTTPAIVQAQSLTPVPYSKGIPQGKMFSL